MFFWLHPLAAGAVLDVPSASYPTIAEAVEAALPGDTIRVGPGPPERIRLEEVVGLEIVGDPPGTVVGPGIAIVGGRDLVLRDLAVEPSGAGSGVTVDGGATGILLDGVRIEGGSAVTGGALDVIDGEVRLLRCELRSNVASGSGGAVAVHPGSEVSIVLCTLVGNSADEHGGGIWAAGVLTVSGSTLLQESAGGVGGGIACQSSPACEIQDTVIEDCDARWGGGIHVSDTSWAEVLRTRICLTRADGRLESDGGGALFTRSVGRIANTSVLHAEGYEHAGGIQVEDSTVTLLNDSIVGNVAGERGAGLYGFSGDLEVVNTLFAFNDGTLVAGGFDLYCCADGTATGGYNLYFQNSPANTSAAGMQGNVVGDPLFAGLSSSDCGADLVPGVGSPAIDGGDPAILDLDGSRSDIGVTGGPESAPDMDHDGFAPPADCDDLDPDVHPDGSERCDPGSVDEDCDGLANDADPEGALGQRIHCADLDGDGYGDPTTAVPTCGAVPADRVIDDRDCDDAYADVSPVGTETCDGRDEDCDGAADDGLDCGSAGPYRGGPRAVADLDLPVRDTIGCGCRSTGGPALSFAWFVLALLRRRASSRG